MPFKKRGSTRRSSIKAVDVDVHSAEPTGPVAAADPAQTSSQFTNNSEMNFIYPDLPNQEWLESHIGSHVRILVKSVFCPGWSVQLRPVAEVDTQWPIDVPLPEQLKDEVLHGAHDGLYRADGDPLLMAMHSGLLKYTGQRERPFEIVLTVQAYTGPLQGASMNGIESQSWLVRETCVIRMERIVFPQRVTKSVKVPTNKLYATRLAWNPTRQAFALAWDQDFVYSFLQSLENESLDLALSGKQEYLLTKKSQGWAWLVDDKTFATQMTTDDLAITPEGVVLAPNVKLSRTVTPDGHGEAYVFSIKSLCLVDKKGL